MTITVHTDLAQGTQVPRREALTTTQAGELLLLSRSRVHQLVSEGRFKAAMVGKRWAIDRESLEEFLAAKEAASDAKEAAFKIRYPKSGGAE